MYYELSYDKEQDLIIGRVEGNFDKTLVKQMAGEFAHLVITTGCEKLLNDLRSANIEHSLFNIWEIPRIIDSQGVPLRCKRALVMNKTSEESRFLETVSVNVGQQVRIFTDMELAVGWLNEDT